MPAVTSRRRFLAASAATGSLLLTAPQASAKVLGANDRVRMAVIGLNGRGQSHLGGFGGLDNVEIAYVVDPDQQVLDRTLATQKKRAGEGPFTLKGEKDIRKVLDDPSIDAISIAAPNHWHSLMTIWGARPASMSTSKSR